MFGSSRLITALAPGGTHFSRSTVRSAAVAIPDFFPGSAKVPRTIGLPDVERLEADTHALRMVDHRQGGDACLGAVRSRIEDGRLMLDASAAEYVRRRLHVALGDLHNLAGWVCFDVGLAGSARVHFARALALAGWGRHNGLVANICYRLGRVCLHHGSLDEASDYFELGLLVAAGPDDAIAAGIFFKASILFHSRALSHFLKKIGSPPILRSEYLSHDQHFSFHVCELLDFT